MSDAVPTLLLTVPIAAPAAMGGVYALTGWGRGNPWPALLAPATILGVGIGGAVVIPGRGPLRAFGGLLRADAVSVWLLLVVGAVGVLACAVSPDRLVAEGEGGDESGSRRWYGTLLALFLAAMSAAVLAGNLGVLWVAIEATTVLTAFLVGQRRSRASVEAAWKYVVICSVGIALAFLGTVLIYDAARHAGVAEGAALDWGTLVAHARQLDQRVTRLGFTLIVLGFGAKAGLVPLHAWLPDAHSQAPAPVSALMSGVLLAVSFTAILRYKVIADACLGPGYPRVLLLTVALLTLAVAALLLLAQRDYKRMLAYSSMEHMGLLALGAATGTRLAMAAVLLHITGHGLAKTVAFCGAGHIAHRHGSTRIGAVTALLTRSPALGALFGLAVLALLGLPPFSLFASELALARAGFAAGLGPATAIALLLVLLCFAALASRAALMLLGPPADGPDTALTPTRPLAGLTPLCVALGLCGALGVSVAPLSRLLSAAATILGAH